MKKTVIALVLDILLVLIFVAVGRLNHDEALGAQGMIETGWPFLAGLLIGWLATFAWRNPARIWSTGTFIWAITVVGGMTFRTLTGQGTALSFILVATITLAVFLLGWRSVAALVERRRARA